MATEPTENSDQLPDITRIALYISVAVDAVGMFVWGCISGRRMGTNAWLSVLSGLINLFIGGIVIAVKLTAGH